MNKFLKNSKIKAKVVVGLGYGDEGKGLTVNELCKTSDDPVIVRFNGGQQAGHTVHHEGMKHICTNFGAGVLQNIPVYFSEHTTFYPVSIQHEINTLSKLGITDPILVLHPLARITTPWDVYENKQCEDNINHGTCGLGVGKTMKRNEGTFKLYAVDLLHEETLMEKITMIEKEIRPLGKTMVSAFDKEWDEFIAALVNISWKIADYSYLKSFDTIIFEGAQGIMLDMDHGVFPHVTYSNTTSKNAMEICDKLGLEDREIYGITRAYSTRHGNGVYSGDPIELTETEHETNESNYFQGVFKTAKMNYERLNFALHVEEIYSAGYKHFLVVTCCNQVLEKDEFKPEELQYTEFSSIYYSYSPEGDFQ